MEVWLSTHSTPALTQPLAPAPPACAYSSCLCFRDQSQEWHLPRQPGHTSPRVASSKPTAGFSNSKSMGARIWGEQHRPGSPTHGPSQPKHMSPQALFSSNQDMVLHITAICREHGSITCPFNSSTDLVLVSVLAWFDDGTVSLYISVIDTTAW